MIDFCFIWTNPDNGLTFVKTCRIERSAAVEARAAKLAQRGVDFEVEDLGGGQIEVRTCWQEDFEPRRHAVRVENGPAVPEAVDKVVAETADKLC